MSSESTAEVAATPEREQHAIELPNGVIMAGMGGDVDAITEESEARISELTPPTLGAESTVAAPNKPITRGKKRFDQLTAEREAETRRADAAETKAKELEARLATPAPQTVAPAAAPVVAGPAKSGAVEYQTRPEPSEDEIGTKYSSYSDFTKDQARWVWEQESAKLRAEFDARSEKSIEADRTTRTRSQAMQAAFAVGRTAYQDFDAVLRSVDDVPVPFEVADAILRIPNHEHILYGLAKDKTELQRIIKITDALQFGFEIAKFIPRGSVASPASTAPVVRTTNAPAPLQPVGAGTRTTSPSIDEAAEISQEAYRKARGLRSVK